MLILGASVRFAVQSARRGRFQVNAADLFGDQDMRVACRHWHQGSSYEQLLAFSLSLPRQLWTFTGGLENHPQLVRRVSQHHELVGTPADALPGCRSPEIWSEKLAAYDVDVPAWTQGPRPSQGPWLFKQFNSCGGLGVQRGGDRRAPRTERGFYQRWVAGDASSVVFLVADHQTQLVGRTRQLVGPTASCPGLREFQYRGSIGPLPMTPAFVKSMHRLGEVLRVALGARGLIGVDLICEGDRNWVVEINPRIPASAELLDRQLGESMIKRHVWAARHNRLQPMQHDKRVHGKLTLYALQPMSSEFALNSLHRLRGVEGIELADWPTKDAKILALGPVATVLMSSHSPADCERRLEQVARSWSTLSRE